MKFKELMDYLKSSEPPTEVKTESEFIAKLKKLSSTQVKTDYDDLKFKYYAKGINATVKIIREVAMESFSSGNIDPKTLSSLMAAAEGIARSANEACGN